MPIIYIDTQEWYPVWGFKKEKEYLHKSIRVSKEDLAFIEKAFEDFGKAQTLITKKWKKQEKED